MPEMLIFFSLVTLAAALWIVHADMDRIVDMLGAILAAVAKTRRVFWVDAEGLSFIRNALNERISLLCKS